MNQQDPGAAPDSGIQQPPRTLGQTLLRLGPGIIIAGSIVGSGELVATTKAGAEAGFWLLWLIIGGCLIKVFAQVEFGRHAIVHGRTPLDALNGVPGPRRRVNWLIWYWAAMELLIVTQQGGILGGVGQVLAIARPLTTQGVAYNRWQDEIVEAKVELALATRRAAPPGEAALLQARVAALSIGQAAASSDQYLWAALVAAGTATLLFFGRYGLIQAFSLVLVVGFTVVTVITVILLQAKPEWAVTRQELVTGLSLRLPPVVETLRQNPLATALAAFGIIGVGGSELIMYPYWCIEKGYARFTGPREDSPQWIARARGWLRVLHVDAWLAMIVYTFATLAFYLLGAAVLGRARLNPEGADMVRTLAQMYVPVFGPWAHGVFLFGAFAVLYSTLFVAAAGNSRMIADGLGLFGLHDRSEATRARWTRAISTVWPLVALVLYVFVRAPAAMILASGVAQAIILPMLGYAVLYFRYRQSHPSLRPGPLWDLMLWLSFAGFLLASGYLVWEKLAPLLAAILASLGP